MPLLDVDVSETVEDVWSPGLARLVAARVEATVTVDGLNAPVTGALVHVTRDGMLVLDQLDDDATVGTVVLVPVDRVVSVRSGYRLRDQVAERRVRVEGDRAFLDRVRELAEPLAGRVRQVGTARVTGVDATDLLPLLRDGAFGDRDRDDIAVALEVLEARGELPARRQA